MPRSPFSCFHVGNAPRLGDGLLLARLGVTLQGLGFRRQRLVFLAGVFGAGIAASNGVAQTAPPPAPGPSPGPSADAKAKARAEIDAEVDDPSNTSGQQSKDTTDALVGLSPGDSTDPAGMPRSLPTAPQEQPATGVIPPGPAPVEPEGVSPPAPPSDAKLTLTLAVREALQRNLDLAAARAGQRAGAYDVSVAISSLLPQVSASSNFTWIDPDLIFFGQPSQAAYVTAVVKQTVFSEAVWANVAIQEDTQQGRVQQTAVAILNVVQQVANQYLSVLRSQTQVQIQSANMELTASHLRMARLRLHAGMAAPSEVYRWESSLAQDQKNLVLTQSQRTISAIDLNRLLNRQLDLPFVTREATVYDQRLIRGGSIIREYLDDPAKAQALADYAVRQSQLHSPDLKQLRAQLKAVHREIESNRSKFFLPSIIADAQAGYRFFKGGRGSEDKLPPPFTAVPFPQDFGWQFSVTASLPIFEGGQRIAKLRQSWQQYYQLQLQTRSLGLQIAEQARSAIAQAVASQKAVRYGRESADAARKTMDLTAKAYMAGAADILKVLDAQRQVTVAELDVANSVFTYLTDLMDLQRAMGRFVWLETDAQTQAFLERLDSYIVLHTPTAEPAAHLLPSAPVGAADYLRKQRGKAPVQNDPSDDAAKKEELQRYRYLLPSAPEGADEYLLKKKQNGN
jgi:outer membrane protein TolC